MFARTKLLSEIFLSFVKSKSTKPPNDGLYRSAFKDDLPKINIRLVFKWTEK